MLFTEPTFLFLFLPLLLALYFATGSRAHASYANWLLLVASVIFYATGGGAFTWLMLGSIAFNYTMAIAVDRAHGTPAATQRLAFAVTVNLIVLGVFKYANFFVDNVNAVRSLAGASPLVVPRVLLPIGISFFTFHAISYVVDVYRRDATAQKSPVHAALYLLLFPQLIAGPIIRYRDIADQLARRIVTIDDFAYGVRRFILGLAKKVLIANVVAGPADKIFAMPFAELSTAHAWLGIVCYTLQIYFDFSGYSDMAIGLGRMFGFRFPGELPLAVCRRQRPGVLAPVAHLAVVLVPRLSLRPARRQSHQPGTHLRQPGDDLFPVRPLARRQLEFRDLGTVARAVSGDRAAGLAPPKDAAGHTRRGDASG